MKKLLALFCAFISALTLVSCCATARKPKAPLAEEFALHRTYGDHAVLQRGVPIRISGTATAGQAVKVTLGEDCKYAVANAEGEWEVAMPAREATKDGESLALTVTGANDKSISCSDILIGEVWLCCGQSNMEMPMWTKAAHWRDNGGEQVIAEAAKYANKIRLFDAARGKYVSPKKLQVEPVGKWVVPTSEDIAAFSAVGYYFGRELNQKLDVPIGLISPCCNGTPIQPWISAEAYLSAVQAHPILQKYVDTINAICNGTAEKEVPLREREKQWHERFMAFNSEAVKLAENWKARDFDDSDWQIVYADDITVDRVARYWLRCTINIPENMAGKELLLKLGAVDDADVTYFNGVKVGSVDITTDGYWAYQRNYRIPAELAKAGKAVVAIQLLNYYGVGKLNPGPDGLQLTEGKNKLSLYTGSWRLKLESEVDLKVIGERPTPKDEGLYSAHTPSALFNSLIYPWTHYNTRGMIWYQGCANSGMPDEYAVLFDVLRADWMKHWNNPKMAFITTQLSGLKNGTNWPRFREMQFEVAQKYDNVGLAVSIDKGNEFDIHPHEKLPVAQRLCAEAMRICYGYKGITFGPTYKSCKAVGDKLVLKFTSIGQGIVTNNGKTPAGFEIAGADGQYYPALAVISADDEITLSAKQVAKPVSARYAWCAYNANLNVENKDGFPMAPFRTKK